MKFWLLVVLGAAGVTMGATALSVLNPAMKRKPVVETKQTAGPQPKLVALGNLLVKRGQQPQHQKGIDLFEIKNSGEADLSLQAGRTNCTCTDLYFSPKPVKLEEPPPAEGQQRSISIKPGETAFAVARWDTKDKGGRNVVSGLVHTNDPSTPQISVSVELDVVQDLVLSSEVVSLGNFLQGMSAKATLDCVAPVAPAVEISDIRLTAGYLTAKSEAIPAAELPALGGKSGQRIVVAAVGGVPIGKFQETLTFKAKVNGNVAEKSVLVQGIVAGELQILGDAKIDFRVVEAKDNKPVGRMLRAARPPAGGDLKLGEVVPEGTVHATLKKGSAPLSWMLQVSVKPGAPAGAIPGGKVTILDGAGKQVAAFVVVGVVNN